jgi:alkylation response protein AidB-like acyl-CoA dehydrogenase
MMHSFMVCAGSRSHFTFSAVINEELSYAASDCLMPQTEISLPYIVGCGTEEQKRRWLPKMVSGDGVTAIAMDGTGRRLRFSLIGGISAIVS